MRIILIFLLLNITVGCGRTRVESKPAIVQETRSSIYDLKMKSIDGSVIDFSIYRGKNLLIVNTASECGYTPQYADLQKLHETRQGDITILGFPSNDFGGQEPGTNEEIVLFCRNNYQVTFQMFEKSAVKGEGKNQLYNWLTSKDENGWNDVEPNWNFCKYLVNKNGELVNFYGSAIKPLSEEIMGKI